MKKVLFLIILTFSLFNVFAEENSVSITNDSLSVSVNNYDTSLETRFNALDSNKKQMYMLNSLYVEPYSKTSGTSIGGTNTYLNSFTNSAFSISTSSFSYDLTTEWRPHKGYDEISKLSFYDLVGAEDIKQRLIDTNNIIDKRYKVFMGVGGTLTGVGGLLFIVGAAILIGRGGTVDPGIMWGMYAPGLALLVSGITTMLCWKINAPKVPDINIQLAIGFANQYNEKLMGSIEQNKFPL